MNDAPIFIIDDDIEELELVQEIWPQLNFTNALEVFSKINDLWSRLVQDNITPFLIISEVRLPGMNGFELYEKLDKDPVIKNKNIPFLFWSIAATDNTIKRAHECGGSAFFIKGRDYYGIKESLETIMNYWKATKRPKLSPDSASELQEHF